MSKKAAPTVIGLFFVLGIALLVGGLLIFSSRSAFHPKQKGVLYFESSLKGLNPGAPVKFRGVTIGSVDEILIRHNQSERDFSMPVIVTIDKKLAQSKSDQLLQIGTGKRLEELIGHGFRARLDTDSLLTGVLYIALDFVTDAPPPVFHQLTREYIEIPTLPSDVQKLLANLGRHDLRGISEKVNDLLTRLDTSLSELNVRELNAGLSNLLRSANQVVATPELTNAITSARQTLDQAGALLKRVDGRVDPLADSVTNTLSDVQKTLADVRVSLRNVSDLIGPESTLRPDLKQTLDELSNASRAIADLAEFLQRNPNALLMGKKRAKEQP